MGEMTKVADCAECGVAVSARSVLQVYGVGTTHVRMQFECVCGVEGFIILSAVEYAHLILLWRDQVADGAVEELKIEMQDLEAVVDSWK